MMMGKIFGANSNKLMLIRASHRFLYITYAGENTFGDECVIDE